MIPEIHGREARTFPGTGCPREESEKSRGENKYFSSFVRGLGPVLG